jgi:hypothetical protein
LQRTHGPKLMDPVHAGVSLFHGFSSRKIKPKFYKNTPELF